jgi:cytochrome c oxidase cbb3-type subunit III
MKSINRVLFSALLLMLTFAYQPDILAEGEGGYDLNAVMKVMLVITIVMIALVMWLTIIYSEKNDIEGALFKAPFAKLNQMLNRSVPIEKEKDIMLDHDFDGIKELDNRIPPWFHALFWGTIVWSVIYLIVFHLVGNGQIQSNEYKAEIQQASFEREMLIKSGAFINEETVTAANDAATLSEGKEIFTKNCVTCHAADGGGIVGPNLTDDYWINGGGIKNVFKTIKYGVPAKGMISWQTQLDPTKIRAAASYILSLHGTKPAVPKTPQGDLWSEPKTDSTKAGEKS